MAAVVDRVAGLRAAARFLAPEVARQQIEEMVDQTRDRAELLDVSDGDAVVGQVWLARASGGELLIHDVVIDDPSLAGELVPGLVERARAVGAHLLGVGLYPGDATRAALGAEPGFVPRATNMALSLDGEIAEPGELELRPMTPTEFDAFLSGNADEYAGELEAAGMTKEAAAQQSREQMAQLLPSGQTSPGMHFFTAWVDEAPIGSLWLCTLDPMAFVYDIVVREDQRRKGYGAAIMNAAALWTRDEGHQVLGLNVFAHNPGARALYDRLGYQVTQEYRALDVPDAG
jgi:GNAT superfamily N-acetyltransferase